MERRDTKKGIGRSQYRSSPTLNLSNTLRTVCDRRVASTGFINKPSIPISWRSSGLIRSLNPVHMIIGMLGRIFLISAARISPVICGMVISVRTKSNLSGAALKAAKASKLDTEWRLYIQGAQATAEGPGQSFPHRQPRVFFRSLRQAPASGRLPGCLGSAR